MSVYLAAAGVLLAAFSSLLFSTLSYALRDFSRIRLAQSLERLGRSDRLEKTMDYARDLIFATAVARLFSNIMILIFTLVLFREMSLGMLTQYAISIVVAGVVTLLASVAIPLAAADTPGNSGSLS